METHKQIVSVLFFSFSIVSILCFSNEFDLSSIISLLSEMGQLITRRNMILLCHFILLFIVKDAGLLSPRRNDSSVYEEKKVVSVEKEHKIEVKGVGLKKKELRESYIGRSMEMVVMEKRELVSERNREEKIEVMESNGVEEREDLNGEEVEGVEEGKEIWELMERRGEEEMETENVGVIVCTGEEELEKESVEEFNRKIEEFIEKFKKQRLLESQSLVLV